jgi:hypothetical protein
VCELFSRDMSDTPKSVSNMSNKGNKIEKSVSISKLGSDGLLLKSVTQKNMSNKVCVTDSEGGNPRHVNALADSVTHVTHVTHKKECERQRAERRRG